MLLSFGGSGGAEKLNEAILSFMARKDKESADIYHIHAAGEKYYADIAARSPAVITKKSKKRIFPFTVIVKQAYLLFSNSLASPLMS